MRITIFNTVIIMNCSMIKEKLHRHYKKYINLPFEEAILNTESNAKFMKIDN